MRPFEFLGYPSRPVGEQFRTYEGCSNVLRLPGSLEFLVGQLRVDFCLSCVVDVSFVSYKYFFNFNSVFLFMTLVRPEGGGNLLTCMDLLRL